MSELSPRTAAPGGPPPEPAPALPASEPSQPDGPVAPAPGGGGSGLPAWLPYFLLAVVPAVVVGVLVFAFAGNGGGGGGGDASAAGVLDGFIRLGGSSSDVESFQNQTPPGYPKDVPVYKGSKILVSFLIRSDQGNSYFVIYQTPDRPQDVLKFFQDKLDQDPWQVELAQSSTDLTGVRFSRPDDADVQGDLSVNKSDLAKKTTIYVSFQDLSPSNQSKPPDKPFVLPTSLDLPPGFPSDMPIFAGKKSASTVTATYFERGGGGTNYLVTFITKDGQGDVIDYYKKEFSKRGWTVTDSKTSASSFELSIDFQDGPSQKLQGSIRADSFQDDADYTQVDMLVQVSSSRGRGN